ncbi:outer membrane protein [Terrihabitans rhizophilus]|uniref:Outer membrane protein n=1 Tax=Terrihabitans rhizophilus TaxID=3092662 RepID=A0ABU4RM62_9HYPH|nr:outer membrane protein [Terrihabitans sp. PJ23]MDX6805912.1 outer membrane protein [Terrihabitans sp. PJ23]
MHKRLLLTNVLLAIMSAGAAHAADMPYPVEAAPAMVAEEAFSWNGFYAGIHGGYASGESALTDFEDQGFAFDAPTYDIEGGLVGLTLGFNRQVNNFVFGIEAEGTWADIDGSGSLAGEIAPSCLLLDDDCTTEYKALGTVTGRAGVAFDRALLFVKGGAAFGLAEYTAGAEEAGISTDTFEDTRLGWTVGAGVEFAFASNVSAKIEYNYIRFEDEVEFSFDGGEFGAVGDAEDELHVVKAGINYHF